jgi:YggT family protein
MCVQCFIVVFTESFIGVLAGALTVAIFVRVILSWVPTKLPLGLDEFVFGVTEPILGPIRRALPVMGGIDFSPFIALIAIQIVQMLLLRLIPAPV